MRAEIAYNKKKMSKITDAFRSKKEGGTVLIPFLTAGDPNLSETETLVRAAEKAGADIMELGVPFSDSLADGPVIQESYLRALQGGVTVYKILDMCGKLRNDGVKIPFVLMISCNIILRVGVGKFFALAKEKGVDGVIIPDAPMEESGEFTPFAKENGIDVIQLVAPTSGRERRLQIAKSGSGFLYYISTVGITGERSAFSEELREEVNFLKREANIPVAVGFGISTPEKAAEMGEFADGVIIGSTLVRLLAETKAEKRAETLSKWLIDTRTKLDRTETNPSLR